MTRLLGAVCVGLLPGLALCGCGGGSGGGSAAPPPAAQVPEVSFASGSTAVTEGGAVAVEVELRLPGSQSLAQAVTVTIQATGAATLGTDYDALPSVTFATGSRSGRRETLTVVTRTDALIEGLESAQLTLVPSGGARLGSTPVHTLTIQDASGTPTIGFAGGTSATTEAAGTHQVDVVLLTGGGTLTQPSSASIARVGGSATDGGDVQPLGVTSVTFPAGSGDGAVATVSLQVLQDTLVELDETLDLALSGAAAAGQLTHVVTLQDDEVASVAFASGASATINEAAASHLVTVRLTTTGTLAAALDVTVVSADGTATAGADYTAVSATVTFPAGAGDGDTRAVAVPVLGDATVEADETLTLSISAVAAPGAAGPQATHTVTLTDDDARVVSFAAASSATTNEAAASFPVTVRLTMTGGGTLAAPLTVDVTSADGTATAVQDYTAVSTVVTFPVGAGDGATQTVSVAVTADTLIEGAEALTLTLSNPSAGTLGAQSTHAVTITDDESASVAFTLAASTTTNEAAASFVVSVRLTATAGASLAAPLSVTATSADVSATAGADYTAVSTLVTFSAGAADAATQTVSVPVLADTLCEGDETLAVSLTGATGPGTIGPQATHTITIRDDEFCFVSFSSAGSATGVEARAGHPVVVRRTGSGTLAADLTVTVTSGGGSATSGTDYTPVSTTVTFPAGSNFSATAVVMVTTLADAATEGDETVTLTLSGPSAPGLLVTPTAHSVTISDDDGVVSFASGQTATANEAGGPHPVELVLLIDGGALAADVTVQVSSADGSAAAGTDYVALAGAVVTFPAGSGDGTVRTVDVTVLGDTAREGDETLTLTLSNATGPGVAGSRTSTTLRITEDDLSWVPMNAGIEGGASSAVAVSPLTGLVWAGGRDSHGNGAYRSTDGGSTWSPLGVGLGGGAGAFSLHPTDPTALHACAGTGVFRSSDGGGTWATITPPDFNTSNNVSALARHPADPQTLLVAQNVIQRTTNGGVTWELTTHPGSLVVQALAYDPSTPTTAYAATSSGVLVSTDAGSTWALANTGLTTLFVEDVLVDPASPATLYVATWGGGVFKSTNGGATWASAPGATTLVDCLAFLPGDSTTVYAGTATGVYRSTNAGASWSFLGLTSVVLDLAVDPVTPTTLFAATVVGVARSTDGGATWTYVDSGIQSRQMGTIAVDPHDVTTLFCAKTSPSGLLRSTDGGATWSPAEAGLSGVGLVVQSMAFDPLTAGTIYLGTSAGIQRSTDGGATWALRSSTPIARLLLVDPTTPTTLYAGTGSGGVLASTDSGATWTAVNAGLGSTNIVSLAIDPTATATLYAGTFSAGAFKTTNAGASWTAINTGLGGTFVDLVVDPLTPTTLYAATSNGIPNVYKSTNGGASWSAASTGLPASTGAGVFAVAPSTTGTVYLYSRGRVYRTANSATTWSVADNGLGGLALEQLAVDPSDPATVYASTLNGGAYKTTTGGQ